MPPTAEIDPHDPDHRSVPPVGTCPSGSRPAQPGPVDQALLTELPWPPAAAVDEQSGVMVVVADTAVAGSRTWTFDLCTNTWQLMQPEPDIPSDDVAGQGLVATHPPTPFMILRTRILDRVAFDPRYDFFFDLLDLGMQIHRVGFPPAPSPGSLPGRRA